MSMIIDNTITVVQDLGSRYYDQFGNNFIWMNQNAGNLASSFNRNQLIEVRGSVGSWKFRSGDIAFLSGRSYYYCLEWADGLKPIAAGWYNTRILDTEKLERFGRSFCMIGDSLTWWERGGQFRDLLRSAGLKYDFAGNHIDPWGFRHSGEGGNNTQDILNRIESIPTADTYFLLIGTNDRITVNETLANIQSIVASLRSRDCCNRVYVSTLLPRNDERLSIVQEINTGLKLIAWDNRTQIIDSYEVLYTQTNWQNLLNDTVHPTKPGYETLVNGIINVIK